MDEKIRGVVKSVSAEVSQKTGNSYWKMYVTVDNKDMQFNSNKDIMAYKPGQNIEVTYVVNGVYRNIKHMAVVGNSNNSAANQQPISTGPKPAYDFSEEEWLRRRGAFIGMCMNQAFELVKIYAEDEVNHIVENDKRAGESSVRMREMYKELAHFFFDVNKELQTEFRKKDTTKEGM